MGEQTFSWNYCTTEDCKNLIVSLNLLGNINWPVEKQLARLYSIANHTERHYKSVVIKKKNGGSRRLLIPDGPLKRIQHNILRNVLVEQPVSSYASAYRKQGNTRINAEPHVKQDAVLKLDIADFFSSITFSMVYRYGFSPFRFPEVVRGLLTALCCHEECLPQGAPTSPYLSNLVMKTFDEYMGTWCHQRRIAYTRYSDDMTFSGAFCIQEVEQKVNSFLQAMGFTLNMKKTGFFRKGVRQTVTGLVVNDYPRVSVDYRRKLRQEIYYCRKYGAASHVERSGDKRFLQGENGVERYLTSLLGRVNYVLQMEPDNLFFCGAALEIKENLSNQ